MSRVAEGLEQVRTRIRHACELGGRSAESVRLIAVSKTHPVEAVREAYAQGQRDFGESYAQELAQKAEALADLTDICWHMVGHLQRNKGRVVARHAEYVHSVDSVELAEELEKRRAASNRRLRVLVEVNVAREPQKSGVLTDELEAVLAAVEARASLELVGLMCVPPLAESLEASRRHFDALAELRRLHGGEARLPELSMGMSADLEPAIAAGATLVRIGTAIFGERPRKQA